MTNHNEEIEILSHEDETRLDTSGTFNKLSDGDSEENISTNKEDDDQNTNQNINREEINNNNIDSSQNIKGENNNIDSNLKYSEPEKRYKNYNQPFGHSNKHHLHYNNLDFSKFMIYCGFRRNRGWAGTGCVLPHPTDFQIFADANSSNLPVRETLRPRRI